MKQYTHKEFDMLQVPQGWREFLRELIVACENGDINEDCEQPDWRVIYVTAKAMLAAAPEAPAQGWRFVRRPDGIGIFAPPPKPGESPRTSDTVPDSDRDLYDLLGKLADQQASLKTTGEQL